SVVMIENFVRRLRLRGPKTSGASVSDVIRESTLEVGRPIVFGITIIMAVYLPIFALEGMSSRMFRPMALTVVMVIFGSLVLALTFVPAVASLVCRWSEHEPREPIFARLRAAYRRWLATAIDKRAVTLGIAVVLVALAVGSMPFMGTEFMPELDEGALLIETRRLPSVSLTESVQIATQVESVVREFPEVETVVTKIGRPDLATEAMGIYQGDVYVILKPKSEWQTAKTKEALVAAMDDKLRDIPGVAYNFTQPLAMRLDEVISGVRSDVAVKLFGNDFETLQQQAERIQRVVGRIPGAADVQIETLGGASELRIDMDRAEVARYGLQVGDVGEFIETAVGGRAATAVIDGRRRFDVVARL
ncbi:efflux RND transporter permease subunit, partial [Candidatus Uhrbacteria bacterium]|nr:efflux RND transporter permease subunit [Candidatus Uhrbacteria bacterium]